MFAKNVPKARRRRLLLEQLEERCVPVASITEYIVPTAGSNPQQITSGPDGNLWFTEQAANKIARITTNGAITEFIVPTPGSEPFAITSGPDGNLWFTEASGNKIGRITTNGAITEFPLPTAGSQPFDITSGPDGNLWFTEESGNKIGRITTVGGIIEFAPPTAGSKPFAITPGPDGNLWFTEEAANQIGRVSTSGAFAEFHIPTAGSNPQGITTGSDGNLWFTEEAVNQIGRVTTSGAFSEFPVPTAGSQPFWITSGPDKNLWFTEQSSNRIAKLVPSPAAVHAFPTAKNGSEIGVQLAAANGTGTVTLDNNGDGLFDAGDATFTFGLSTDTFVVGDWNGSGFDSVGVVRGTASGAAQWTIDTNEDYAFDSGDAIYNYGLNTDKFVTGDWTGSGTTRIGVVRTLSDGSAQWVLNTTGTGVYTPSDTVFNYGLGSDTFITGDWNGAGKTEIGVVRALPSGVLQWVLNTSGSGVYSSGDSVFNFGLVGDTPVVGDWNGGGKTEIGVVRQQADGTAVWSLDTNGDGAFDAGDSVFVFGQAGNHFLIGKWKPPAALLSGDGVLNALVPALQPDANFRAAINWAILAWEQAGIVPQQATRLENANYRIATLSGGLLGETSGNDVVIDATAQGHGWSESATPQPRRMDLFTALGHEMGHLLGLPDQTTQSSDLMFESLLPGVRKTPTTQDVDAVFAGGSQ